MFGSFGASVLGSTEFAGRPTPPVGGEVAVLGDTSSHGGTIITSNQDGTLSVGGIEVAVAGAMHSCPISNHGVTPITAVTVKTFHNGKLIVTEGALTGCGALVQPSDRGVTVE